MQSSFDSSQANNVNILGCILSVWVLFVSTKLQVTQILVMYQSIIVKQLIVIIQFIFHANFCVEHQPLSQFAALKNELMQQKSLRTHRLPECQ